jgi:hypothetical protein
VDALPADRYPKGVALLFPGRPAAALPSLQTTPSSHPATIEQPEKTMLILTTNALTGEGDALAFAPWQGPRVLVVLPGSGMPRAALRGLDAGITVIEHLQPARGAAALLVDVMHWLAPRLAGAEGPLLYLDRPADPAFVAEQAELGRSHLHDVASELAGDGRLAMLRLGDMVATSPLLPAFFGFLGTRSIDDATLADLLGDTFARTYA